MNDEYNLNEKYYFVCLEWLNKLIKYLNIKEEDYPWSL